MTNNLRVYLWIALALAVYFNYTTWTADYGPRPESTAATAAGRGAKPGTRLSDEVPQATSSAQPKSSTPAAAAPAAAAGTEGSVDSNAPVVHVVTDVLDLDISTRGGTIQRVDLPKYQKVKGEQAPVRLENVDDPASLYVLQSGLTGAAGRDVPNHLATFTVAQSTYQLDSSGVLRVPLTWTSDGITVTKTYVFRRGQYAINVEYNVVNHSDSAWQVAQYAQILRNDPRTKTSMFNFNAEKSQFHGPAIQDGTKYRKLDFQGTDNHLSIPVKNGWVAALQHHFVSAIVPPRDQLFHLTLSASGDEYLLAATGPVQTVPAGASQTFGDTFFVGPKLQSALAATGPELARVADYGALYLLAEPLFWLLDKAHAGTGNWGVAIILITLLLKILFYPLSEASGRSMAKMKALAPRIKNLQEMYKDDREKLGKATMELYQREKVNPVAGCLPMIIQMPVFLAFYWVLLESVEMRQAPFMGWIHDLSSKDPYYILPAIMAAAMFAQFKLNPSAADPTQQKVMMVMPLVMSVTFAFFPAGLVLYWVTNTLLSMAQQWNINRRIIGSTGAAKRA